MAGSAFLRTCLYWRYAESILLVALTLAHCVTQFFEGVMWRDVASKEQKALLKPALVFQEIMSYLKGSAEALQNPDGLLTLEQYLEVQCHAL